MTSKTQGLLVIRVCSSPGLEGRVTRDKFEGQKVRDSPRNPTSPHQPQCSNAAFGGELVECTIVQAPIAPDSVFR